jgi:hypothetical protein
MGKDDASHTACCVRHTPSGKRGRESAETALRHIVQAPVRMGDAGAAANLPAASVGIEARIVVDTVFWLGTGADQPNRHQAQWNRASNV